MKLKIMSVTQQTLLSLEAVNTRFKTPVRLNLTELYLCWKVWWYLLNFRKVKPHFVQKRGQAEQPKITQRAAEQLACIGSIAFGAIFV